MIKTLIKFGFTLIIFLSVINTIYAQSNKVMKVETGNNLYIYRINLTPKYKNNENWNEETNRIMQLHFKFLDGLGKKGILIFAGKTKLERDDKNLFGIVVFKAKSLEQAKDIILKDPAVINGIQEAGVYPFGLALNYFENLN